MQAALSRIPADLRIIVYLVATNAALFAGMNGAMQTTSENWRDYVDQRLKEFPPAYLLEDVREIKDHLREVERRIDKLEANGVRGGGAAAVAPTEPKV